MKRIILILSLLLTTLPVLSQSFKVNYRLTVRPANNTYGGGCNNNINVKIFYRVNNGSEQSKLIFNQDLNGGGGTYNLPQTIVGGDVVFTKVEVRTSRAWKRFIGGCGGNGSFNNNLRTTAINSRCSKFLSGNNLARWWITTLNIDVKPVVNLTPKNATFCQSGPAIINSGFHSNRAYSGIYRWEFLDPVNTVTTITSQYQSLLDARDIAFGIWKDCEDFTDGGGGGPGDPILRAEPIKKKKKKEYSSNLDLGRPPGPGGPSPGGGNPSASCRRWYDRYIQADLRVRNFTGSKYYQRKIWKPIPSENGKAIAEIYLSELYSNVDDQLEALTNKVINIRINPNCSGEGDINTPASIAQIQFLSDPPSIAQKPTFNSPTCSYDPIGNFEIYFTRQLLSSERLNINLKRKLTQAPFTYQPIGNNINIRSFVKINDNLYKYTWNPSGGNELPEGGDYRIELSGASGNPFCNNGTLEYDFNIATPPKVNFLSATRLQDVTCFGGRDGKIKIKASGGSGSFRYILNGTLNQRPFSNETTTQGLTPGSYQIKVIDSNGCQARDNAGREIVKTVVIGGKAKITHSAPASNIVKPGGLGSNDGSIRVNSVSGGTPNGNAYNYTVTLSNSATITGTAYTTGFTINGLPAGNHKIKYRDSKGCEREYPLPTITDPDPINFSYTIVNADCKGRNGKIKISNITGGYENYTIKIEKPGIAAQELTNVPRNTEKIFEVPAGKYKITITDTRSGIRIKEGNEVNVVEPEKIIITGVDATPISCNGDKSTVTVTAIGGKSGHYEYAIYKPSNIVWQRSRTFQLLANPNIGYQFIVRDLNIKTCQSERSPSKRISEPTKIFIGTPQITHNTIFDEDEGEIKLNISGGTPGYSVTWKKTGDATFNKSGATISRLKAGIYVATVEDDEECIITSENIIVEEPSKLEVTISETKGITCSGGKGILKANPYGGSETYTYRWFRNGVLVSGENSITIEDIAGSYTIEVNDGFITAISPVKILHNPIAITFSLTKFDISCNNIDDGKIKLAISGGAGGYEFSIDNKTSYEPVTGLTNNIITGLTDGSYDVWIKDQNGCETPTSKKVTIVRPSLLEITNEIIVNNQIKGESKGEIQIEVSGGIKGYTYQWIDKNNPLFNEVTQNITNLPASIYNVTITDNKGCIITKDFEIKEPLPLEVTIEQTKAILCNGYKTGELFATVIGGYPIVSTANDFDYKWYEIIGANTNLLNVSNLKLNRIGNLKAGNYRLIVSDSKGTSTSKDFEIIQPLALDIKLDANNNVSCFEGNDGAIKISVSGGTKPYTFEWKNEDDISYSSTLEDIENLKIGTYIVKVIDANDCERTSNEISITEPTKGLTISNFEVINLSGFETNNGSISVEVNGGTPNYTYSWRVKGSTTEIGNTNIVENLEAGEYEVTITDTNLCSLEGFYTVTQPDQLVINTINEVGTILCNGEKGVNLTANVSGGVGAYVYSWVEKGTTTELSNTLNLTDVSAGTYVIKVTDNNNNEVAQEYTITEPSVLEITNLNSENVSCFKGNDGFIELTVSGGVLPYTYSWKHGANSDELRSLTAGEYEVTIRDKNLCEISTTVTITEPLSALAINTSTIVNVTGNGLSNGTIDIEVIGGTPTYSYEWKNSSNTILPETSTTLANITADTYTVKITDDNGCFITENYTVTEPALLEVDIVETSSILCNGNKGSLTANVSGGVGAYVYSWVEKGTTTELSNTLNLTDVSAGTYVIKVTDNNNNEVAQEYTITEPSVLEITNLNSGNVSCFKGNDGFIELTVSGGVLPYTYSWKHGANSDELRSLTAGEYEVTIRDKNLCEISTTVTITEPLSALAINTSTIVNVTGNGLSNGTIDIEVIGGTPTYSYEWKNSSNTILPETSTTLANITADTYTVKITDDNGCFITENYTVTEPALLEVDIVETSSILCNGNKGSLTANVSGGVGAYVYSWVEKETTTELSNTLNLTDVSAGTYVIKVTDNNNNEVAQEYTITEPSVLEITNLNSGNVSCFKGNDGFIELTVSGGVLPYTYSWKHGANSDELRSLTAGEYEVTIRDKNLCEISTTVTITEPLSALAINTSTIVNVTGNGLSNGTIDIEVIGGTPTYSYEWKNSSNTILPETSTTLANITADTYTVKITDDNGCFITENYTVTEPALLEVDIVETSSILCNGNKGSLRANVSGGVAAYTYSWIEKGTTTELSNTSNLTDIVAGTYVIKVTDNNNNEIIQEYTISEPAVLEITGVNIGNVTCYKGNDGFIELTVSGGVLPYTYNWTHSSLDTNRLENVVAGNYEVTITDANGCMVTKTSIDVTQPNEYAITNVKLERPASDLVNDGSIEVSLIGGVAPYTYVWTNESGITISNTAKNILNDKIENLGEGRYTITITDAKNCIITETYNLANPGEILVAITQTQEITCYNASNAILDVITVGGAGGNNYKWYNAANDQQIGTDKELKNIPAGEYYVVVSNAEGIEEKSAVFTVAQPNEMQLLIAKTDLNCFEANDGVFEIQLQGGVGNYEYRFRNQAGFNSWTTVIGNTIKVENLERGTYKLQVRDGNNCIALTTSGNSEFEINIDEPTVLELTKEEITNSTGFGVSNGSIEVEVAGGTPGYMYEWLNSSGNQLTTGVTSLTNVTAGIYTLKVVDTKGCTITKDFELTQPELLETTISRQSIISCNGAKNGELKAVVTGGVLSYSYQWYKEGNTIVIGTTDTLSNLGAGTYYVVVEDANANTVTSTHYILNEPTELEVALTSDYQLCGTENDWTVNTAVTGGTAPYVYLWNTGANTASLNNVIANTYSVTVVDVNGCRTSASVTLDALAILELTREEVTNPTGFGLSNGSIEVEVAGGTPGYMYEWLNSSGNQIATGVTSLTGLAAGMYTLKVVDTKGCTIIKDFELTQPEQLEVTISRQSIVSCHGVNDGELKAVVTGGVSNYSYQWYQEGGTTIIGTTAVISGVGVGTYYVIVKDANANTVTSIRYTVNEPAILELALTSDYQLCGTGNDWTINTAVTGGTAPYVYLWNTGTNTASLNNVIANTYSVTVVDANGCRTSESVVLTAPAILELTKEEITNPTGFGVSNGSIEVEVSGGTPGYMYEWLNSSGNQIATGVTSLTGLAAGIYTLKVVDTKGCTIIKDFELTQPEQLEATISIQSIISCHGANDGQLKVIVRGGVSNYSYQWYQEGNAITIGNTDTISNLEEGTYYVIVKDANANTVTSTDYTINEPAVLEVTLISDYQLCGTGNDWTINTVVTGGTAPYVYLWNTGTNSSILNNVISDSYSVTVVDVNGCRAEASITTTIPPTLTIATEIETDPTCFEGNDGSIAVNAIGGTPPYEYRWNTGIVSETLENITAGTYEVIVSDSKGCQFSKSYTITNPDQIQLDLGEDVTLCKGQSYLLDATIIDGVTYEWTSTNGFTSNEVIVEVTEEGIYTVKATDGKGCQVEDQIEIKSTGEDISANFLMSSQVFTKETFIVVNVSDPVPDQVNWILPNEAIIKETNNSFAEISFETEGTYEITLHTVKGDCEAFLTKTVLVLDREFDDTNEGLNEDNRPMIQNLVVYPNPSSGVFALEVDLKEVNPLSIKIFSLLSNDMVDYKRMDNEEEYKIDYNLNLNAGLYFVVVEAGNERLVKKIIIR